MTVERMIFYFGVVCVLCITLLIAQCSQRVSNCKVEAIKAGMAAEKIASICNGA